MTATAQSLRPALAAVAARLERNRAIFAGRFRRVRPDHFAVDRQRAAITIAIALAVVVLVGMALDPLVGGLPQSLPAPVLGFFVRITNFGKSGWLLIPSAVIVVLVAFGDWRRTGRVVAAAWGEIAAFASVLFLAVAVSGIVTDILKAIVGRSRPAFAGDAVFVFNPFTLGGYPHYSFPSGHATTMAAVAVIVTASVTGRWRAVLLAAAAVVAVSRVMLGVHYPGDVVGGMLIGGAIAWLIVRLMAEARVGFEMQPDGSVRPRFAAIGALRRRKALAILFPGLWTVLAR